LTVAERQRARSYGRLAETLCALRLQLLGWRIVARDFRTPMGEIDIIARRGRILAFIEVKARRRAETAPEALTAFQQQRIERTALGFLQGRSDLAALDLRFDVMLVGGNRWPVHLPDAWRPEE
jgi:putative endonuclease